MPVPFTAEKKRAVETVEFTCSECHATIESTHGPTVCEECGHVPRHGSD